MSKKNKAPELSIEDLEQITFDAMRHCGVFPPMSSQDIAAIESELAEFTPPFSPSDPRELLKRLEAGAVDESVASIPFPTADAESIRNLARAARDGGELSEDIEQRMAEDKAKYLQREPGDG